MENPNKYRFTNEQIFSIFLYTYGGFKSKLYEPSIAVAALELLCYRLKGKDARPDLSVILGEHIEIYKSRGIHLDRWNGDGYNPEEFYAK